MSIHATEYYHGNTMGSLYQGIPFISVFMKEKVGRGVMGAGDCWEEDVEVRG